MPSKSPTTFSAVPATASTTFSVFVLGFFTVLTLAAVVALSFFAVVVVLPVLPFETLPPATLVPVVVRGLEVFAFVVELRLVVEGVVRESMVGIMRGLELPFEVLD